MISYQSLANLRKPAKNTLQDQLNAKIGNTSNSDTLSGLHETPSEQYQQTGSLVVINTPIIVLHREISHQQEMDRLLRNFNAKVLQTYICQ